MDPLYSDDQIAVAEYISDMAFELSKLAAAANHRLLAHLLQMAWLESERICGRPLVTQVPERPKMLA